MGHQESGPSCPWIWIIGTTLVEDHPSVVLVSSHEDIVLKVELCDQVFVHRTMSTLYHNCPDGYSPANKMAIRAKENF